MKKHMKTTLGHKLLAYYLVFFAITFFAMSTIGHSYIRERAYVEAEHHLQDIGITLLSSDMNQQSYTKTSIRSLYSQLLIVGDATDCRIIIVCDDGDIVMDTSSKNVNYNVYTKDSSFLRQQATRDTTMEGYLPSESMCVCMPIEKSAFMNGYLLITQANMYIDNRATYYSNVLSTFFYLMILLVGLVFILIYIFNVRPLHQLRNGAKDFSISHDNPPIIIHSNDEYGELAQTLNVIGAELAKFDEYQRKFISNISHDFRSPLTNIRGYVQAMADGIIPVDNQEKYLNIILYETERLTKLSSDLLDVNNYDKDHIMLNITEFDIHETILKTCDSLESSIQEKQIRIDFIPVSTNPLLVKADHNKIVQVLHNLLENAVKFSEEGSPITIATRLHHERVYISIKDTGIGIPKEELPEIWNRFYKTDLSRGKDKLGSGLGLSICREIINAHKQTIDVVSTVGVGSKFTFTLPKA